MNKILLIPPGTETDDLSTEYDTLKVDGLTKPEFLIPPAKPGSEPVAVIGWPDVVKCLIECLFWLAVVILVFLALSSSHTPSHE